ncbi:AAA family ATPase [Pseudomonas sp. RIT357]|uniref:AAA family ATPase n=1 Tax=Pseudomonas sp. RIT357 TaxID=1470593 RepID=UPI00044F1653|nr:AAA family ATPase [Pseudomonas sp. RIT357]EZP64243.1 ATP-binding protein [Pseudomonas sp. RIT357]
MTNRYIESLHVDHVRKFSRLDMSFGPGFNFIAGPNGCGKTSVLVCIAHCFDTSGLSYSTVSKESAFWVDMTDGKEKLRIGLGRNNVHGGYRQGSLNLTGGVPLQGEGRVVIRPYEDKVKFLCPLFIGASRNITYSLIGGVSRELPPDEAAKRYKQGSVKSLYGEWDGNIKQWLINRYFIIDKPWAEVERKNFERLEAALKYIGPSDSEFAFVEIGRDLEPIFSIYGQRCYLEELSSGFQAVFTIIAMIFEWIEIGGNSERLVESAYGTVLIDELDLHLHPEWQFTLRDGLAKLFPKLQFIVTTHSPHLLASAKKSEVLIMPVGSVERDIHASDQIYSGWTTDQILSEVMDVKSLENKDHHRLVTAALAQAELKSLKGLEQAIINLEAVSHPSDTIVTVLKTKLASLVALKDD